MSCVDQPYQIFDIHTHAFPDKIAARAMAVMSGKAGIPHHHDGSFAGLLAYERAGGACGFLLLPIATSPAQTVPVNDWAASRIGGGAYAFGSIHPDFAAYADELDRMLALGLQGVKLHPEYQDFYVDEERMFPLYRAIFDRGLILYFHAGVDLGYQPPIRGDARRIARVCDAFPQGKIVAAHMGAFCQYRLVYEHLAGRENLWMDTSFAAQRMPPSLLRALVKRHGADKVMFGTDAPWSRFEHARDGLLQSGLSHEVLADIFYHNAARLLGIEADCPHTPVAEERNKPSENSLRLGCSETSQTRRQGW